MNDQTRRVLKYGETFAIFDCFGDALGGEHGIYHQGMRFLSHARFVLNGRRPLLLNSDVAPNNSFLAIDATTPDFHEAGRLALAKGTVHIFRTKLLWEETCHEHVRIENYGETPLTLDLSWAFGTDYADLFEVRGIAPKKNRPQREPVVLRDGVILSYHGLDGIERRTNVRFMPDPLRLTRERAEYALTLAAKEAGAFTVTTTFESGSSARKPLTYVQARADAQAAPASDQARRCDVRTSNEQFNAWLNRSSSDLAALASHNSEGAYPYAGLPWYNVPFGRDGILTALQYLSIDPSMARGVLRFLAKTQATREHAQSDAEPGKIMHEARKGELVSIGELPFGLYYGAVDTTPLFVVLVGAYYQRTGDLAFVRSIWPNVENALTWIERYGDVNGFLAYQTKSTRGLIHQGWKDSSESVFHSDGRLAQGAVALAEVQGYVYLAKTHAADLAQACGQEERGKALRREAAELRSRFERAFWCERLATFAIALDAKGPCEVRSSNAGQVLWSGIASPEHARRTAETLFSPTSFSGWGIRTIASGEARYNPMSYHNGSVWPHDNALIAEGLARYGMRDKAILILTAMFDASLFADTYRIPELFCGFARRPGEGPSPDPGACSPQAWASASVFYLLQACLGISFSPDAPHMRLKHPMLPRFIERMTMRNVRVGSGALDLLFQRRRDDVEVNVLRQEGDAEMSVEG